MSAVDGKSPWLQRVCEPSKSVDRLAGEQIRQALIALPGWQYVLPLPTKSRLCEQAVEPTLVPPVVTEQLQKRYRFVHYSDTCNFATAVGDLAEAQDHHPDLYVSYRACIVIWTTHYVHGISSNDLLAARLTDNVAAHRSALL